MVSAYKVCHYLKIFQFCELHVLKSDLMILWISSASVVISPFPFLIFLGYYLSVLSLVWLRVCLSCWISPRASSWFFIVYFVSNWFISAVILMISWLLLFFGVLASFVLEVSDVLLSCWYETFLISLWRHLVLWTLLLALLSLCPVNLVMLCLH